MNKKFLKKIKNLIFPTQNSIDLNFQKQELISDLDRLINSSSLSKIAQIQIFQNWKNLKNTQDAFPKVDEIEFRAFSQNGEDGILLYIFSQIGILNKRVVEVCAGDGIQCNSANLIINHGWEGLLFDGNDDLVKNYLHYREKHFKVIQKQFLQLIFYKVFIRIILRCIILRCIILRCIILRCIILRCSSV
jgi:hypothetical protein